MATGTYRYAANKVARFFKLLIIRSILLIIRDIGRIDESDGT